MSNTQPPASVPLSQVPVPVTSGGPSASQQLNLQQQQLAQHKQVLDVYRKQQILLNNVKELSKITNTCLMQLTQQIQKWRHLFNEQQYLTIIHQGIHPLKSENSRLTQIGQMIASAPRTQLDGIQDYLTKIRGQIQRHMKHHINLIDRIRDDQLAKENQQILPRRRLQELVDELDPSERLDMEVEELLLELADEFIDSVTGFACSLAQHRKSSVLEVRDLQLHLERNWGISVPMLETTTPGTAPPRLLPRTRPAPSPSCLALHNKRLALISKFQQANRAARAKEAEEAEDRSISGGGTAADNT
eukprot:gnl/Trimastix_PCT/4295.p1 GENE.gnl/Trimastix_PCT/4295~~gnl/Trimastix_PCT/4295.p1  ORF type:complete len:320 (+),score=79.57 gnl/Trimastix_PCT/4295:54-962(+)